MTKPTNDARRVDLAQWEVETGRQLPLPIDTILDLENRGHCVDLADGSIVWDVDNLKFETTVVFDALGVILDCEGVEVEGGDHD